MNRIFSGLLCFWLLISSNAALASDVACSYAGVFSTLAVDKATSDISGYEIIITVSPYGHEVIFTEAQGNFPIKPVVVDAKVNDGWISFEVTVDSKQLSVKARPTCSYLETNFSWSTGSTYTVSIPRTKSFWDNSKNHA